MSFEIISGTVQALEGVEDTVAPGDQMIIDRDLHEHGIEHDTAQHTGVQSIIPRLPRLTAYL